MTSLTTPFQTQTLSQLIRNGKIQPWTLLGLLLGRSLLCLLAQVATAAIFYFKGDPNPWIASVPFWNVYGTLVDISCLLLLHHFLKKEGFSIQDLFRVPDVSLRRDILIGFGLFLVLFPTAIIGVTLIANLIVFGSLQPDFGYGLLLARELPTWATLYSLLVWWVIWSPTESAYYNGYLFPRIEVFTGRTWMAVLSVGFFWTLQHVFFPFIPDEKYILWRFLQFLGIGMVMPWLFSRLRRLRALVFTHWLMDILSVVLTIKI